jgi:hypothetical protein
MSAGSPSSSVAFLTPIKIETLAKSHRTPGRYRVLPTTSWPVIQKYTVKIAAVLESITPGDFTEIDL